MRLSRKAQPCINKTWSEYREQKFQIFIDTYLQKVLDDSQMNRDCNGRCCRCHCPLRSRQRGQRMQAQPLLSIRQQKFVKSHSSRELWCSSSKSTLVPRKYISQYKRTHYRYLVGTRIDLRYLEHCYSRCRTCCLNLSLWWWTLHHKGNRPVQRIVGQCCLEQGRQRWHCLHFRNNNYRSIQQRNHIWNRFKEEEEEEEEGTNNKK